MTAATQVSEQCDYVFRSGPLLPERFGSSIGGVSLGRCPNKVLPGFVVCHEHVNKEALIMMVRQLTKELEQCQQSKGRRK